MDVSLDYAIQFYAFPGTVILTDRVDDDSLIETCILV